MFFSSIIDNSRLVIDDSKSIIYNSRVTLQLVASFTIAIYNCHIFIVQAIGWKTLTLWVHYNVELIRAVKSFIAHATD